MLGGNGADIRDHISVAKCVYGWIKLPLIFFFLAFNSKGCGLSEIACEEKNP